MSLMSREQHPLRTRVTSVHRKSSLAYMCLLKSVFVSMNLHTFILYLVGKCVCVRLRVCILAAVSFQETNNIKRQLQTDPHLKNMQNGYLADVCNDLLDSSFVDCCRSQFSLEVRCLCPHTNT